MLFHQDCWKPFPPSFYKTHTEEEIAAAIDAANKELVQYFFDNHILYSSIF